MARDIAQFRLSNDITITIFKNWENSQMRLSSGGKGTVCEGKYVDTEFHNKRLDLSECQLIGSLKNKNIEKRLGNLFSEAGYYHALSSNKDAFLLFIENQGYDMGLKSNISFEETIWIIAPKKTKGFSGDSFNMVFKLCNEDFCDRLIERELLVKMTKITPTIEKVIFRVDIPEYIYNKCSEDLNESARPKLKYIESEKLSDLHSEIQALSYQAISIRKEIAISNLYQKKIAINFSSSEIALRDDLNYAYTGQKFETRFNWFVFYETQSTSYKYFTFKMKPSGISSSRVNREYYELSNNGIYDGEKNNQKFYLYKPSGVIINWTPEREEFLNKLDNNFRELKENLNKFLSDLDDSKIDNLLKADILNKLIN